MRRLTFHDVPAAALPLYLGEPDDMVREVAHLICDHAFGVVYFRPLDPYDNYQLPEHVAQRYSVWELAALMPRRQIVELYREAASLIEQLHAGIAVRRTDLGWVRSSTSDADAAFGVIADIMAEVPVAPVEWAPSIAGVRMQIEGAPTYTQLLKKAGLTEDRVTYWAGHGVEVVSGRLPKSLKSGRGSRVSSITFSGERRADLLKGLDEVWKAVARSAVAGPDADSSIRLGRLSAQKSTSHISIKSVTRG